jgi:hypothetical protein
MPRGKNYLRRFPVSMHIGKPIDLKQYADEQEAINAVREAVIEGMKKK